MERSENSGKARLQLVSRRMGFASLNHPASPGLRLHLRFARRMMLENSTREDVMSDDADHTRRWLIHTGGAAVLSSALAAAPSAAQVAGAKAAAEGEEPAADQ